MCVCARVCACACLYVCMYVCIYIYIYIFVIWITSFVNCLSVLLFIFYQVAWFFLIFVLFLFFLSGLFFVCVAVSLAGLSQVPLLHPDWKQKFLH